MSGAVEFGTFVVEDNKVNEWAESVAQLVAAAEKNPDASMTITVDANDEANASLKVQRAANDLDRTARKRHTDYDSVTYTPRVDSDGKPVLNKRKEQIVDKTGNVRITFTITAKHKVRRGNDK